VRPCGRESTRRSRDCSFPAVPFAAHQSDRASPESVGTDRGIPGLAGTALARFLLHQLPGVPPAIFRSRDPILFVGEGAAMCLKMDLQ